MSKAGDLVVVIPISTTPEPLRMGRGAGVNSSKAQAFGIIPACTKHTGSWPAASLWSVHLVCLYPTKAVPLSQNVQMSLRQQPTKEKQGLRQCGFRAQGIARFKKDIIVVCDGMRGSQTKSGAHLQLIQTCTQDRPCPPCCNVQDVCQSGLCQHVHVYT